MDGEIDLYKLLPIAVELIVDMIVLQKKEERLEIEDEIMHEFRRENELPQSDDMWQSFQNLDTSPTK